MVARSKHKTLSGQPSVNPNFTNGLRYQFGMNGLQKDYQKALDFYEKAALEQYQPAVEKIKTLRIPKRTLLFFLGILLFSVGFGFVANELWASFFFPGLTYAIYSTKTFNTYWYQPGWAYKLNKSLFFLSYLVLLPVAAIIPYIYGISWFPITFLFVLGFFVTGAGVIQWLDEKNIFNSLMLGSGMLVLTLSIIGLSINTASQKYIFRDIEGGIEIIGYRSSDTIIDIPRRLNNRTVLKIGNEAFRGSLLEEVTLPDTVISIGDYAFANTPRLRSIHLPENSSYGDGMLMFATALESIQLPENLVKIPDAFLMGTFRLRNINLPTSVHTIGVRSFAYSAITDIILGDNLTIIKDEAFRGTQISRMSFPDSLEHIGVYLLADNLALETIEWPANIQSIPEGMFYNTGIREFVLPLHVQRIEKAAFKNAALLETVILHDSVISIQDEAFRNALALKTITIPSSITTIASRLFEGAISLESIILPPTLTSIQDNAFRGLYAMTKLSLPEGITAIGSNAFSNMTNLEAIKLPDSLTSIGSAVFSNNVALKRIDLPEGITHIRNNFCYQCESLTALTLPNSIEIIEAYAFYQTKLNTIELPFNLIEVGDYAFFGNSNNQSITFNDNLSRIGLYAFYGHYEVKDIHLPSSIKRVEDGAFGLCYNTERIVIPSSIEYIGYYAFFRCTQATIYMDEAIDTTNWSVAWNPNDLPVKTIDTLITEEEVM